MGILESPFFGLVAWGFVTLAPAVFLILCAVFLVLLLWLARHTWRSTRIIHGTSLTPIDGMRSEHRGLVKLRGWADAPATPGLSPPGIVYQEITRSSGSGSGRSRSTLRTAGWVLLVQGEDTCAMKLSRAKVLPTVSELNLTEAFRRAVLRLFVRLDLFDEDQAAGMLTWPHAGFHVHTAVWVPEDDRAFATRLARYCARNPVALERLTYDRTAKAVTYRSDKSDGPTAGTETADPLEFLARVLVHIPDKGHVTTRYYGWYANRPRGMRDKAAPTGADGPPAILPAPRLAPTEATRRWAALLQQLFEVDPLACPTCHGAMRIVAFITQAGTGNSIGVG